MSKPVVIHVSPHPDDESIAAPCTLLALRDAGFRVVNLAVSLGRQEPERRRAELARALEVAGFENREFGAVAPRRPPGAEDRGAGISRGDDLGAARRDLGRDIVTLLHETGAELIVGPHPREGHHGHQTVARAIREAVWGWHGPLTWWMWSVWSELPRPTLVVDCPPELLAVSKKMLEHHHGELARTDYLRMHEPARIVNAVKGVEKAYGYGSGPPEEWPFLEHAELLTEISVARGRWGRRWRIGPPRKLDPAEPLLPEGDWKNLDDVSLLSSTRLRGLYRPCLMSAATRLGWPGRYGRFDKRPLTLIQLGRFATVSTRAAAARAAGSRRRRQ